jgi:hypothetical protein
MKSEIANELYKAAHRLGAKSDLLGPIGSFGDTSDWVVWEWLSKWNSLHCPDVQRGPPVPLEQAIQLEIYIAFQVLAASPALLDELGKWGDGYDDAQFLPELRAYNRRGSAFDDIDHAS